MGGQTALTILAVVILVLAALVCINQSRLLKVRRQLNEANELLRLMQAPIVSESKEIDVDVYRLQRPVEAMLKRKRI